MTTPPNPPDGAPADPAGLMHEQTFNEALAGALRQLWRGDPQLRPCGAAAGAGRRRPERPDILVAPPDIYNVIIEVEFDEPAFDDACRKPGRLVVGATGRARALWAV